MTDTAQESIFAEAVERMLFLESVQAIRAAVDSVPRPRRPELFAAFDAAAARLDSDEVAELELLAFVRHIVEDSAGTDPWQPLIERMGSVVSQAVGAPTLFSAYEFLRSERLALTGDQFDVLQSILFGGQRSELSIEFDAGIRALVALGVLLRDEERLCRALFLWGAQCREHGRPRAALRRFRRATEIARRLGDPDLTMQAESGVAAMAEVLGDREGAVVSFQALLDAAERDGQDEYASGMRRKLVTLLRDLGRYSEALALLDREVAWIDSPDRPEFKEMAATARLRRGLILEEVGRFDEGELDYLRARELARQVGARGIEFEAMNNWAASALKRGDVATAVRRFETIRAEVEGWGHPGGIASTHNNLGTAYMDADRPEDAFREYAAALKTKLALGDRYGEAIAYLGMGDAKEALGDIDAAKTFWTLALVPYAESGDVEILAGVAPRLAGIDDVDDDAAAILEDARATLAARGPLMLELVVTAALARRASRLGDEATALTLYEEAVNRAARSDTRPPIAIDLETSLGRLETKRAITRGAGYRRLGRTLAEVEGQLAAVTLDERRSEIAGRFINVYDALLEATLTYGEELGVEDPERECFQLHESAKARSFIAGLSDADVTVPEAVPADLQASEERLLSIERGLQDRERRSEQQSAAYRQQRLREVHAELEECWTAMAAYAPEYVRFRRGDPAGVDELRSALAAADERMAVVSFFCGADTTTAFVVRPDVDGVQTFTSPIGRARIAQAVLELRRAFNGDPRAFPPYPPITRDKPERRKLPAFESVSAELLRFLPAVEDVELLCVAPHGPLHLLPLHAMPVDVAGVVADRHALAYTPSATAFLYSLRTRPHAGRTRARSVYVAGTASLADAHLEFFEADGALFDSADWQLTSDFGPQATPARAREQLAVNEVAHITCHGHFDSARPLRSGLLLASGRSRPPRDLREIPILERREYLLTAEDLLRTEIRTELLMLRACSTGLQGERNAGDELDGLIRSLIYAGCRSVIVSLWNVDQQSSLAFAHAFYEHWSGSAREPKWRALWNAQRELRSSDAAPYLSHPYHWAPFVLVGDWR